MSECFRSGENGRELQKGDKYDWKQDGDTYTLTINKPLLEDDGTYILLVKEVEAKTSGYLTVKKRDPEYWFVRPLKEQELGYTNRPYSMSVELSEPGVNLKWLKNNAPIVWSEVNCVKKDEGCVSSIYFPNCEEDDTSYYSAIIMEFVKNGYEDQTNCWFQVIYMRKIVKENNSIHYRRFLLTHNSQLISLSRLTPIPTHSPLS